MASLGHIVVGAASARFARGRLPSFGAMLFWAALAMLPDADVIGFRFGVQYGDPWGHRGATHSLVFAFVLGILVGVVAPSLAGSRTRTTALAVLVAASHGLLDALTDGGRGIALLWPFTNARYFAPWTPIPVAPMGWAFLSPRGFSVATVELVQFLPLIIYACWPKRRHLREERGHEH